MKMYIATNGNVCFEGATPKDVIEASINSNVDFEEMNFLEWTWYKAVPCKLTIDLTPIVEKPVPKTAAKK
jgi:hypothetical protein